MTGYAKDWCPRCSADVSFEFEHVRGPSVPWGSTWAAVPDGIELDVPSTCEVCGLEFTPEQVLELEGVAEDHAAQELDDFREWCAQEDI